MQLCHQNPDNFSPKRKYLLSGAPCYWNADNLSPTRKDISLGASCYQNTDNLSLTRKDILSGDPCYRNYNNLSPTRKEISSGAFRVLYTPIIFFGLQHREIIIIAGLNRSHYKTLLPGKSKLTITAVIQHRRTYRYLFLSPLLHPSAKRNNSPLEK